MIIAGCFAHLKGLVVVVDEKGGDALDQQAHIPVHSLQLSVILYNKSTNKYI